MAFHPLATATLLLLSLMTIIHAALPSEQYWNSMLPATPMPRAITMALRAGHGIAQDKFAVNDGYDGKRGYNNPALKAAAEPLNIAGNDGNDGKGIDTLPEPPVKTDRFKVAGNDGLDGKSGYNRQQHIVPLKPPRGDAYAQRDLKTPLLNPPTALYFLEKDLFAGNEFSLEITRHENAASTFIPRRVADSIPFSADKLSKYAENMKNTINLCSKPSKDETMIYVTSLETMIDYTIEKLGKNIQAVSTVAEKDSKLQKFKVLNGIKMLASDEAVVYHKLTYPYAVFLSHGIKAMRTYSVPLIGADGTKAMVIAVCHFDTSGWNPDHIGLRILGIKAGTVPVCHFLPENNVVWTRR